MRNIKLIAAVAAVATIMRLKLRLLPQLRRSSTRSQ